MNVVALLLSDNKTTKKLGIGFVMAEISGNKKKILRLKFYLCHHPFVNCMLWYRMTDESFALTFNNSIDTVLGNQMKAMNDAAGARKWCHAIKRLYIRSLGCCLYT